MLHANTMRLNHIYTKAIASKRYTKQTISYQPIRTSKYFRVYMHYVILYGYVIHSNNIKRHRGLALYL